MECIYVYCDFQRQTFLKSINYCLPIIQQLFLTTLGIVDTIMVGNFERGVASVGLAVKYPPLWEPLSLDNGGWVIYCPVLRERNYENIRKSMAIMIIIVFHCLIL